MPYGDRYPQFFGPAQPGDPFPNPQNEGQRVANARARAARAGTPIGSGYLNPRTSELQDPDRGFGRVLGENPWLGALIALSPAIPYALLRGAGAGHGAALGSAAGGAAEGTIPALGNVNATIDALAAGGGAATTAGTIAGTTAAGTSAIAKLRQALTSPAGIASLAALVPSLVATARGGGGDTSGGSLDELRRMQAITEARMRRTDPLHEVATQLAFQRAPIAAKAGISLPRVPLP